MSVMDAVMILMNATVHVIMRKRSLTHTITIHIATLVDLAIAPKDAFVENEFHHTVVSAGHVDTGFKVYNSTHLKSCLCVPNYF